MGFFASQDRTPHVSSGLDMGRSEKNTTGVRFTRNDRGSLSERDCRKLGPSGESNAQPIESLPPGALAGCFDGVPRQYEVACAFPDRSAPMCQYGGAPSKHPVGGDDPSDHPCQSFVSKKVMVYGLLAFLHRA